MDSPSVAVSVLAKLDALRLDSPRVVVSVKPTPRAKDSARVAVSDLARLDALRVDSPSVAVSDLAKLDALRLDSPRVVVSVKPTPRAKDSARVAVSDLATAGRAQGGLA